MKRIVLLSGLLALTAGCSLREPVPFIGDEAPAQVMITVGAPSRSCLFNAERENTVSCFVLASYRGGFLASTGYYSAQEGDFDASSALSMPVTVGNGYPYTFYVLANIPDPSLADIFPPYEEDVPRIRFQPRFPEGSFIPMAGSGVLSPATRTVPVELKRLVAKIDCNITLPAGAVVEEARLCQTASVALPFGKGYTAEPGFVGDGDSFAFDVQEGSGYISGPSGVQGYTLTSEPLYVLENMQGEESGNTDPWHKYPSDASRAAAATYIDMMVSFPDGQVEMRFYLGADALGDYNIERNSCYTLNISIWDAQRTCSGWSMVDLRYTDNWPGGDFLAGQVRTFSFHSPDVTLSLDEGSDDVIELSSGGNGKWLVSGIGDGDASIDIIAENTVRGSIPISVKSWSGTAGELALGLHGNSAGLFEAGVMVGDRKLYTSDLPVWQMPDDASLLCSEVLGKILYGEDGTGLPLFEHTGVLPYGIVGSCSADPSFPARADSLFVTDPSDWENRYGEERLFEHEYRLTASDIDLDIPVKISNALCTPDRDSVRMTFHDWSLSVARTNDVSQLTWSPYGQHTEKPLPSADQVNIFSVPVTDTLDANAAVSYLYSADNSALTVTATLNESTRITHTVGLVDVYADVTNRRSGAVYRTALFKEENYLHLCCGADRLYAGKDMTWLDGKYHYEADKVSISIILSAPLTRLPLVSNAARILYETPGIIHFTDESYILYPWGGALDPVSMSYPYCFVARRESREGNGSFAGVLYYDYFWEYTHVDWEKASELYYLTADESLPFNPPAYGIDTEKTSRLFGGWLVLHKYDEIDDSTNGWVDIGGINFPNIRY